jgi:restriction system protein
MIKIPTYDKMMNPLIKSLQELGGSGTITEINEKVFEIMNLSDQVLEIKHGDKNYDSEVDYRLAWSRTYLKKYGLLENSSRGVWSLTQKGKDIKEIDPQDVVLFVRGQNLKKNNETEDLTKPEDEDIEKPDEIQDWRNKLRSILLNIDPSTFERLIQRLLRESGFDQVEITGKSGDGGIDGKGIYRMNGFLGFHVMFQCKRWKGQVSSPVIRDFRGALQGRADKGLMITTGSFTRDAIKEANRDGAPPIDLIDGDNLIEKLKQYSLGIKIELVEKIEVDELWYNSI